MVENELQQLSQQKDVLLAELGKLKGEEQHYRSQLSDLKSQVKGHLDNGLARKTQKTDAKNFPLSARNGTHGEITTETGGLEEEERPHLSNGFTHVSKKSKAKKPTKGEDAMDGSESESEGEEMTVGSMDMADLAQPSSKPKVCTECNWGPLCTLCMWGGTQCHTSHIVELLCFQIPRDS